MTKTVMNPIIDSKPSKIKIKHVVTLWEDDGFHNSIWNPFSVTEQDYRKSISLCK